MLRELRKKAGLTQQELAEVVGISRPTITCYETGRLSLDVKVAKKDRESPQLQVVGII